MLRRIWPAPALAVLLAMTVAAYWPGLSGGFLFDDFVNLDKLNSPGPVDNWPAFWRYITSGIADPTGRPLSLLSFLIDARSWPADPAPFLRTNLVLHLLNGALLFVLLALLGRQLGDSANRNRAVALLGAGLWMLHPLFVSTTLYIVQREAMLPATFTLLGLIAYVHGRARFVAAPRHGLAWMVIGITVGTLLAMLSKANGILVPLLALVLEVTVFRQSVAALGKQPPRWLVACLLVLPSLVVFAYVLSFLPELNDPLEHRPWTIAERLLTQPRVMLDYLQLLAVPRVLSTGLYNDGYAASTSLLDPPSTLFAIVAIAALLGGGIVLRKRAPAVSAALLFFFAGHILESTTIPLELYFEHRNYLPAMLLPWPLARAICHWRIGVKARALGAVALLSLLGLITFQRAQVWGNPEQMALLWAAQSPHSSRAQATAAAFQSRALNSNGALDRLAPLWRKDPYDLQLALNYANAKCATGGLSAGDVAGIAQAFAHAEEGDQLVHRWLSRALGVASNRQCQGLDNATLELWLAAAWRNPRLFEVPGRRQDLYSIGGQVALQRGDADRALQLFDQSLAAYTTPDAAAMQTALLATAGQYRHALAHLDHYERLRQHSPPDRHWHMQALHAWVLERQGYWPYELGLLRSKLLAEIAAMQEPSEAERTP